MRLKNMPCQLIAFGRCTLLKELDVGTKLSRIAGTLWALKPMNTLVLMSAEDAFGAGFEPRHTPIDARGGRRAHAHPLHHPLH
jgi:hypothetical protein